MGLQRVARYCPMAQPRLSPPPLPRLTAPRFRRAGEGEAPLDLSRPGHRHRRALRYRWAGTMATTPAHHPRPSQPCPPTTASLPWHSPSNLPPVTLTLRSVMPRAPPALTLTSTLTLTLALTLNSGLRAQAAEQVPAAARQQDPRRAGRAQAGHPNPNPNPNPNPDPNSTLSLL